MAQKEGLIKTFKFYAVEDGVIRRGKKVIKGKNAIADWYIKAVRSNETLAWNLTFIDVSNSGDLAYTYGDYVFTSQDSLGNKKETKAFFILSGKDKMMANGVLFGIDKFLKITTLNFCYT